MKEKIGRCTRCGSDNLLKNGHTSNGKQVVAYYIVDRTKESCQKLEERIPERYKETFKFSDLWDAYNVVFPENHKSVDKTSGET